MQEIYSLLKSHKYTYFKEKRIERIKFFQQYGISIEDMLREIESIDYEKFEEINYAFAKLESALDICDFLYQSQKENKDTDKIIITTLVSLAEVIYRLNNLSPTNNEELVSGFFYTVKDNLEYKIRGKHIIGGHIKVFNYSETLYYVRNDYIHNGNFTGLFFLSETIKKDSSSIYNIGSFKFSEKYKKNTLLDANSECSLTYNEFLEIFLRAFIKSLEKYIK